MTSVPHAYNIISAIIVHSLNICATMSPLSLLVVACVAWAVEGGAPSFCHGLDCPVYTVLAQKEGYEVRLYNASKWVGTTVEDLSWDNAGKIGFQLVAEYISGANSAKAKIPMALPVAVKISPGQGPACDSSFTVLFFIPFSYQANPPTPTNPNVTIVALPSLTAYVIEYSGDPTDDTVVQNADQLANDLQRDKANFVSDFFFTGTYDSPYFRYPDADRHNEVWLLAA